MTDSELLSLVRDIVFDVHCASSDEKYFKALMYVDRMVIAEHKNSKTLAALERVMVTLSFSASSPADQRIYDEARALLAEHGRVGAPVEMVEAHREWEGRR
jgi:hypothetical protein